MGGRGSGGSRGSGSLGINKINKSSVVNKTNSDIEHKYDSSEFKNLPKHILEDIRRTQLDKSIANNKHISSLKQRIDRTNYIIKDVKLNAEEENRSLYKGEIEPYFERIKQTKKELALSRKNAKVLHSNLVLINRTLKKKGD